MIFALINATYDVLSQWWCYKEVLSRDGRWLERLVPLDSGAGLQGDFPESSLQNAALKGWFLGSAMEAQTFVKSRPGGRTERVRKAVAEAVLSLVNRGTTDFEIQEVSALSGVHRTTISRRWPDRGALMAEAMAEHVSRFSVRLSGDWEADVRTIMHGLWQFYLEPAELGMNRMLAVSENPDFHEKMAEYWNPIMRSLETPLRRGKEQGLVRPDVDEEMVILMAAATLVMFTALTRVETDQSLPERLARQVIGLCRI